MIHTTLFILGRCAANVVFNVNDYMIVERTITMKPNLLQNVMDF